MEAWEGKASSLGSLSRLFGCFFAGRLPVNHSDHASGAGGPSSRNHSPTRSTGKRTPFWLAHPHVGPIKFLVLRPARCSVHADGGGGGTGGRAAAPPFLCACLCCQRPCPLPYCRSPAIACGPLMEEPGSPAAAAPPAQGDPQPSIAEVQAHM